MTPDSELLRRYAASRDEAAFAEIVQRHANLVYGTALRLLNGDAHLAQDVTQEVFADLAREAAQRQNLTTTAGWLHSSARFRSLKAARTERRRRAREQEASIMTDPDPTPAAAWEKLCPLLDEAVNQLNKTDRDAVLLRYFENKSHREVGAMLGVNENAARMRVERAMEKMRGFFENRKVPVTTASLTLTLEAGASAAPLSLAQIGALSTAALTQAALGTTTAAPFVIPSILAMNTSKIAAGIVLILAVAGSVYYGWGNGAAAAPAAPDRSTQTATTPAAKAAPSPAIVEPPPPAPLPVVKTTVSDEVAAQLAGSSTDLGFPALNAYVTLGGSARFWPLNTPSTWADVLAEWRKTAHGLALVDRDIIKRDTQLAKGDPAKLAKVEEDKQRYDEAASKRDEAVNALEKDPAVRQAYVVILKQKFEEKKEALTQELESIIASSKGEAKPVTQAEGRYNQLLDETQQALDNLEATAGQ